MLSDVVGQVEAIKEIREFLFTLSKKDISKIWKVQPPKGILFTGPPGTGKTMSVRALCNELDNEAILMELKYKDIESQWVGGRGIGLKNYLENVMVNAENNHVILFIDEIRALLPIRNENLHSSSEERVTIFLEWLDGGIKPLENVTLIGSTNCLHLIDHAAKRPGRIDRIIEFYPLNSEAIIKGFKVHLNLKQLDENQIGKIDWEKIELTIAEVELSGAAIPNILDRILIEKAKQHSDKIDTVLAGGQKVNNNDIKYYPTPISTEDILNQINTFLSSPHI